MIIYYHSKCTTSFFIADGLGFRNVLRTDDTDLKFVCKKLKYSNPNGVTPMDFEGWIAHDIYRVKIWGLDQIYVLRRLI
jgi:hypothetical protein